MNLLDNYRLFELRAASTKSVLPTAPDDRQKYSYVERNLPILVAISIVGFGCVTLSAFRLSTSNAWLLPLLFLLAYTVTYFAISQLVYLRSRSFDLARHRSVVQRYTPWRFPSVDVFLPTCGEPMEVLENTWGGVRAMRRAYPGKLNVYCLDDAHDGFVRRMALKYGFTYMARPNRGWFKKAGNLRHAFESTDGDFIAIFDADFRPRADFLAELIPYFFEDERVGIVQSPQYFDVREDQNWIERGAGAVQELFYRAVQTSRHSSGGAICVGSNAIYRRAALDDIGGTALIEHSEDVHTGFNLAARGWRLRYVPLALAKGLCPSEMGAFFKQQYRWCMGSMSLLTSAKFWRTRLPVMTRLCYLSGFMYYIHTAIYAVFTPVIPLIMLFAIPEQILLANYLLILPSVIYMHVVFPLWHRAPYGIEAAAIRTIYGWAHLAALIDRISGRVMEWQATGASAGNRTSRYMAFRVAVVIFNFVPALFWVGGAAHHVVSDAMPIHFVPILLLGIYYLFVVLKIVAYRNPDAVAVPSGGRRRGVLLLSSEQMVTADFWAHGAAGPRGTALPFIR